MSFISPEMFTLLLSLEFVIVILIGGVGSLHGAVLGSIFVVMVDPFLSYLKDDVPRVDRASWRVRSASPIRAPASRRSRRRRRRRAQGRDLRHHHHRLHRLRAVRALRPLAARSGSISSCSRSTRRRRSRQKTYVKSERNR